MSDDYIFLVLQQYDQMRATGKLSLLLSNPSPANLREACLAACERPIKHDEITLIAYFGSLGSRPTYTDLIGNTDLDKFKPLQNFILRKTTGPKPKVVELLAWLTEFEHRPFRFEKREILARLRAEDTVVPTAGEVIADASPVGQPDPDQSLATPKEEADSEEKPATEFTNRTTPAPFSPPQGILGMQPPRGKKPENLKIRQLAFLATILTLAGIITCLMIKKPKVITKTKYGFLSPAQGCMIWSGDHYRTAACDQIGEDTPLVPFDALQMNTLRLISRPDTLTHYSVGKAGYFKARDGMQFFTATGPYPLDTTRLLKPVTVYILNKYARLK